MSPLGTSNNWNHAVFVYLCLLTSLSLTVICGEVALHSFRGGLAYFYLLCRMLMLKVSGMDLIFSFHSLAGFPRSQGLRTLGTNSTAGRGQENDICHSRNVVQRVWNSSPPPTAPSERVEASEM